MKSRISDNLALILPLIFLTLFFVAPLVALFIRAIGMGLWQVLLPILSEDLTWISFFTTFNLALTVSAGSLIIAVCLTYVFSAYKLPGASALKVMLILPIIVPPFVAGIGFKKIFSRFGPLNILLTDLGILDQPLDWLGSSGFWGVALAEILHYYPIVFLSLLSSTSALDYSLIQAAQLSGAGKLRIFRSILLPLYLPSTLAALALVFTWSFSELGTPLIFDYRMVLPVKLFNALDELHVNPRGYVYVLLLLAVAVSAGMLARYLIKGQKGLSFSARAAVKLPQRELKQIPSALLGFVVMLSASFFLLAHFGVLLLASSDSWSMSVLPDRISLNNFQLLFEHPLVTSSLLTSLGLAVASCSILLFLSVSIFYALKQQSRPAKILSAIATLSLVVPGVVMAFAYLQFFRDSFLDPRINPLPLLAFAYAARRLPVMLSYVASAISLSSVTLEEAARMSAAGKGKTFSKVSLPLALPFFISGLILSFTYAMFEVSETLMLAQEESFFPVSKTIYNLLVRPDAPGLACALGVLAFIITLAGMLLAARTSGRKFEDLFRY